MNWGGTMNEQNKSVEWKSEQPNPFLKQNEKNVKEYEENSKKLIELIRK